MGGAAVWGSDGLAVLGSYGDGIHGVWEPRFAELPFVGVAICRSGGVWELLCVGFVIYGESCGDKGSNTAEIMSFYYTVRPHYISTIKFGHLYHVYLHIWVFIGQYWM